MTKNTNIRFYEVEEEDKRAWDILHSLDKKQFKSQSRGIAIWSLGQEDMRLWEALPKQI